MSTWIAVAVGGAIGATLRLAAQWTWERLATVSPWMGFPGGTLVVNVVGCFLLAWWSGSVAAAGNATSWAHAFVATGVLGAFTTFSTFGVDAWRLILDGRPTAAAAYVLTTLATSGAAVLIGWSVGASTRG